MTAGLNMLCEVWKFDDIADDVGGNTPTGTILWDGVQMRLQNAPNSLTLNIQGYETDKFFSAIIYPRPEMNLVEKKHYIKPTSPPNHRYFNKMFRIVSIQEPNVHPSDPRRHLIVNLERSDIGHSENYQ